MISRNIPKTVPSGNPGLPSGNPIFSRARVISAGSLNQARAEVEKFGKLRGSSGISVTDTPGGPQIRTDGVAQMYIRLTGTANESGGYPWAEVIRVFEQGFTLNGNRGENQQGLSNFSPAYESRTSDIMLQPDDTVYLAYRSRTSGEWNFDGKN